MTPTTSAPSTPDVPSAMPHGCFEGADARGCYELRYFGFTPVLRHVEELAGGDHLGFDDPFDDQDCECNCHDQEGFEDDLD